MNESMPNVKAKATFLNWCWMVCKPNIPAMIMPIDKQRNEIDGFTLKNKSSMLETDVDEGLCK